MLLSEKICIITGAASARGIGRATARVFAKHGGRAIILDLDEAQAQAAAAEIGEGHRGLACDVTDKAACVAAVDRIRRVRPDRHSDQQCRHYAAVEDHGHRATKLRGRPRRQPARDLYISQAAIPAMQRSDGRHRLHVFRVGATRRRHLWRTPLFCREGRRSRPRKGDGARIRTRQHPCQLRNARPHPDRYHGGKLTDECKPDTRQDIPLGRLGDADDVAGIAFPGFGPFAYVTGAVIDVNGGMLIH